MWQELGVWGGAPSGMRSRSSKRVMPSKATFSITMLMSGKLRSCRAAPLFSR